jgi:hypothetical protein
MTTLFLCVKLSFLSLCETFVSGGFFTLSFFVGCGPLYCQYIHSKPQSLHLIVRLPSSKSVWMLPFTRVSKKTREQYVGSLKEPLNKTRNINDSSSILLCTVKKRVLFGPYIFDCDSTHTDTILFFPVVVFEMSALVSLGEEVIFF